MGSPQMLNSVWILPWGVSIRGAVWIKSNFDLDEITAHPSMLQHLGTIKKSGLHILMIVPFFNERRHPVGQQPRDTVIQVVLYLI
jgi:hypothetical protein